MRLIPVLLATTVGALASIGCVNGTPEFLANCTGAAADIQADSTVDVERSFVRDTLVIGGVVRARYAPQWTRQAMLRVFLDAEAQVTQVCLYESSGEADFDTAAINAVLDGDFDQAAIQRLGREGWVSFPVLSRIAAPSLEDERYRPMAHPEQARPHQLGGTVIAAQAAVLNHLLPDSIYRFWSGQLPEAICIGVGPDLPTIDPSPALLEALEAPTVPLYRASECGLEMEARSSRGLIVLESGIPAIAYWVDVADAGAETPWRLMAGFFRDGLTAQRWDCFVDRTGDVWTVEDCRTTGIS